MRVRDIKHNAKGRVWIYTHKLNDAGCNLLVTLFEGEPKDIPVSLVKRKVNYVLGGINCCLDVCVR